MSWAVGYDSDWDRDIGYGVPAKCDQPGCDADIDRGMAYRCGGNPYNPDEHGCGLFFCGAHGMDPCGHCFKDDPAYQPSADTREWIEHKLIHDSWGPWRRENPAEVDQMRQALAS